MKSFLGKKILLLTAHPDDESYVAAGAIFKNYQAGGWSVLVCASYGEKGTSHMKRKVSAQQMKKIRKGELNQAAKILHIAPVKVIGVPDGKVKNNKKKIFGYFANYAKIYKPQVIISFGRDGISGHHDHIAVGEVAKAVAKKLHIEFISFTLPPKIQTEALQYLKSRRSAKHYSSAIKFKKPDLKVNINPGIKKKALRCHKSQLDGQNAFTGFPEFAVKELLRAEYFVREK